MVTKASYSCALSSTSVICGDDENHDDCGDEDGGISRVVVVGGNGGSIKT